MRGDCWMINGTGRNGNQTSVQALFLDFTTFDLEVTPLGITPSIPAWILMECYALPKRAGMRKNTQGFEGLQYPNSIDHLNFYTCFMKLQTRSLWGSATEEAKFP